MTLNPFGTAEGSLGAAIAALLIVLGWRFAQPSTAREAIALLAYAAAIVTAFLGARGAFGGAATDAGMGLRLAGAALLVAGLLVAGSASKARRSAAADAAGRTVEIPRLRRRAWLGLVVVLLGFLARAPSPSGAVAVLVAAILAALAAR